MSFHLVDRIQAFAPGRSARATLQVRNADFPACLVAEAVGQLAAWIAMERTDFAMRPVAAIVGELIVEATAPVGDTLELAVEVSALRSGAMRYGGRALAGGRSVLELRCTGAMLPMDVFDDPARVRAQFERLRGEGEPERSFPSREEFEPRLRVGSVTPEGELRAELEAPAEAAFYADHFPHRAVYPATLLLDAQVRIAQELLRASGDPGEALPEVRVLRNAKVRAFTPPGGSMEVRAKRAPVADDAYGRAVRVEAFSADERVSAVTIWAGER